MSVIIGNDVLVKTNKSINNLEYEYNIIFGDTVSDATVL